MLLLSSKRPLSFQTLLSKLCIIFVTPLLTLISNGGRSPADAFGLQPSSIPTSAGFHSGYLPFFSCISVPATWGPSHHPLICCYQSHLPNVLQNLSWLIIAHAMESRFLSVAFIVKSLPYLLFKCPMHQPRVFQPLIHYCASNITLI